MQTASRVGIRTLIDLFESLSGGHLKFRTQQIAREGTADRLDIQ